MCEPVAEIKTDQTEVEKTRKEKNREYMKKYREKNPEKYKESVRKAKRKFCEKNKEHLVQYYRDCRLRQRTELQFLRNFYETNKNLVSNLSANI